MAPKGGKSFAETRSKSPAVKKPAEKGQLSSEKTKVGEKQVEKPSYSVRPQTAKANKGESLSLRKTDKQSALPSKLVLEIEKLSAKVTDKSTLKKIDDKIESEKKPISTIMKINHDVQFMKYRAY